MRLIWTMLAITFYCVVVAFVSPVRAATVALSNGTSCVYAQIVTDTAGNLNVSCAGDQPPPPPPPPPPNPVPIGCPAAPAGMIAITSFPDLGVWFPQVQKSGQVVSIPLPKVVSNSGQISMGENVSAASPQPVLVDITISKCPGFIDTDQVNPSATHPNGSYCSLHSPNGTYNSVTWFGKAFSIIIDPASANRLGYCWAGESEGKWYFNARWTYSSCPFGQGVCGFAIQQNLGPY